MDHLQRQLHLRVFLCSPSDVADERGLARQVLSNVPNEPQFQNCVYLEEVAWDSPGAPTPLVSHLTPQEAINQRRPKPSECDVVLTVLWSRMGTPLPIEYTKPDGKQYLSGTEWEYLDAIDAAAANGTPDVLVYRRTEKVLLDPDAPNFDEATEQRRRVQAFFQAFENPDGSLRRSFHCYDTPSEFASLLEDHLREIIWNRLESSGIAKDASSLSAASGQTDVVQWKDSPYPGLRPFTEDEAPIFFGRGRETDGLVSRLASEGNRFVAVIGASGSGKSSLVAAGLRQRLNSGAVAGSGDWAWVRFSPGEVGEDPFIALAVQLARTFERQGWKPRELAAELREEPEDAAARIADGALAGQAESAKLLLYIDQFEELFTLVAEPYRGPFADFIASAAREERLRTIVTLRADFYHHCTQWEPLVALLRGGSYPLGAPGVTALTEMITKPALASGVVFEEGLVDRILEDTGTEPGALALMEFALSKLYELRSGKKLTRASYDELGGVAGAIEARAEAVIPESDSAVNEVDLSTLFRALVAVDPDGAVVRRRAALQDFSDSLRALIDRLVDARLLVTSDGEDEGSVVEVAHEALLRHWARLRRWLEGNRDFLLWRQRLGAAASDWERTNRERATLLRGALLAEAERWLAERGEDLSDNEAAFIRESIGARDREAAAKKRRVTGAVAALLLIAASITGWQYLEAEQLRRERAPIVPETVVIEPGTFMMGAPVSDADSNDDERPVHKVTFEKRFAIGKYEVTFEEFDKFAFVTGRRLANDEGWGGHRRPVINVSWEDAVAYAVWLSKETGNRYRLPTEAEWEHVARAGSTTTYWWGDGVGTNQANCDGCGSEWDGNRTAPVGSFEPNAFGVYDTAGNVWEWVEDCWHKNYQNVPNDGRAWGQEDVGDCSVRVIRGGSWGNEPQEGMRSAYRYRSNPADRYFLFGFRLAQDL